MALKPRYALANKLANKLLHDSKISCPPVDPRILLKHLKIELISHDFPKNVSAVLMKVDGITVVGINKNHPPNRRNFSIAHEIGHYLLGHNIDMIIDPSEVSEGRFDTEHANKIQEQEANVFASELLMPAEQLKKDFQQLRDAKRLAEKYHVSEQALWIKLLAVKIV